MAEWSKRVSRVEDKRNREIKKRQDKIKKYRKEVSRKAAIANKRLRRLEEKGVKTPAYEKWQSDGGEYFSVKGKSYNEVQSELARINSYLDSATSSLTGARKVVKSMMKNTGIKAEFSDWKTMKNQTANFFEIASRIEQYFRTVEDRASSLGYQKIWEAINRYVEDSKKGLDVSEKEIEKITKDIIKSMKVWEDDFKAETTGYSVWGKLDKF